MRRLNIFLVLTVLQAESGFVHAQVDCGAAKLPASGAPLPGTTYYGSAIDADDSNAVVGAEEMVVGGVITGAAWVFEQTTDGWGPGVLLVPPDGGDYPRFGCSVAIEGDSLLVGARNALVGQDLTPGAVYSFQREGGGWTFKSRIVAGDVHDNGVSFAGFAFGISIDVESDVLAVGAPLDNSGNGFNTGAVYLYENSGEEWMLLCKLYPPDGGEQDSFGSALSLSGERLYVSAPWHDDPVPNCGAVYVYVRQGADWVLEAKLQAEHPQPGESLGAISALGDDRVAAGAAGYDSAGWPYLNTGRVLLFERVGSAWACTAVVAPTPVDAYPMYFGISVLLRNDDLLVGSRYSGVDAVAAVGSCYRYRKTPSGWVQEAQIAPLRPATNQRFGVALARSGNHVIVGAPGDSSAGAVQAGAAFAIDLSAPDCNETGWPDACEIVAGQSLDLDSDGVPDECATVLGEPFCLGDGIAAPCPCGNESAAGQGSGCLHSGGVGATLTATGVPSLADDSVVLHGADLPSAYALYFQGTADTLPQSFGDGLLCVSGSIHRLGLTYAFDGTSTWPTGGSQPVSAVGQTQPGDAHYQVWYRSATDFCTPATFNLSNALRITWAP